MALLLKTRCETMLRILVNQLCFSLSLSKTTRIHCILYKCFDHLLVAKYSHINCSGILKLLCKPILSS